MYKLKHAGCRIAAPQDLFKRWGKSGLHGNRAPDNVWLEQSKWQCRRKLPLENNRFWVRLKRRGKSPPHGQQCPWQGKPCLKQDQMRRAFFRKWLHGEFPLRSRGRSRWANKWLSAKMNSYPFERIRKKTIKGQNPAYRLPVFFIRAKEIKFAPASTQNGSSNRRGWSSLRRQEYVNNKAICRKQRNCF